MLLCKDVNVGSWYLSSCTDILKLQVKIQIGSTVAHTVVPQGNEKYIGLDNGETKEFCTMPS